MRERPQDRRPHRERRPAPLPRPFFTLSILYLFVFFFLFCLALALPALLEVARTVPPGPKAQAAAEQAAYQAVQGRLLPAFLLALATLVAGARFRVLPGLRPH